MSSATPQTAVRNQAFYMDFATFKAESEVFKIPIDYLKANSAAFHQMLSSQETGADRPGQSDENAIKLDGVSKEDFEYFLMVAVRVKYPGEPAVHLSTPHWLSVLKLANLWGLDDIRRDAIAAVSSDKLSALDRLSYGRLYKVEQWVEEGYTALVDRQQMIDQAEAEQVGWKEVFKLCQLREQFYPLKQAFGSTSPTPSPTVVFGTPRAQNITFPSHSNSLASGASSFGGLSGATSPRPQTVSPPSAVTSASAVRQAFAAELEEIRAVAHALMVPATRNHGSGRRLGVRVPHILTAGQGSPAFSQLPLHMS
ncbi:hypothetical protein EYR38_007221 [Pleurotus pulmonarius]|nr:hypothetical protein EYR38_007221 [Pleurotus pulmonarius]